MSGIAGEINGGIVMAGAAFLLVAALASHSGGSLNGIKAKTVGDGQHGTARWATKKELKTIYRHVPFRPAQWRKGENLPKVQGLVLGCEGKKNAVTALVDSDDIHCLMIGASGVGKTAFFLYPNLEYACASGMSSFRILSTFMNLRLFCQAHRILEKLREVYHRMYQIHGLGIGEIGYQAKGTDMVQQDADQLSLCAFQIASPQFMDMFGGQKNAGRISSVRHLLKYYRTGSSLTGGRQLCPRQT